LTDAEKVAVGLTRSLVDFTYYNVPYNAVAKATLIPTALAATLWPMLTARAAAGDTLESLGLVRKGSRTLQLVMSALILPVIGLVPELLALWLGAEFARRSSGPTRVLLLAFLVYANAYVPHAVIRARSHPILLPLWYAIQIPIVFGAVYLLVGRFGILGAALAWVVRATIDSVGHHVLAAWELGERVAGTEVWLPAVAGALCLLAFEIVPDLGWVTRFVVSIAAALAVLKTLMRPGDAETLRSAVLPWLR
jgi:O-antigen/teichoic acid export membrane protein